MNTENVNIKEERQDNQKPYYNVKVFLLFLMLAIIVGAISILYKDEPKIEPIKKTITNDFPTFVNVYNSKTDLQRESFWKEVRDKEVQWSGKIEDVRKGIVNKNEMVVVVKNERYTFHAVLADDEMTKKQAMTLNKGSTVALKGVLTGQDSLFSFWEISKATIVK
ncbi:hypothetical protein [Paenibacillus tyrfis]|uniref:hypothetical protein n=1 Tax=Paenibacillus tyrfis TaxID=1501230 RepID=UPI000B5873ED|nr:hypothetical protein [Paenibacillus tyrfis]